MLDSESTQSTFRREDLGWRGQVGGLHVAPRAFLPVEFRTRVKLIAGKGVEGDRYANGCGHLSRKHLELGLKEKRHLTLFEQETVDWLEDAHKVRLRPGEHRRNITTIGVPLNFLIGKKFRIGSAIIHGYEKVPCTHLDDILGQSIVHLLINRAGLDATILRGGTIEVGDPIEPLE